MYNKKFWATTFTLSGTTIGAGMLGLPYAFSKSGFLIGFSWLILLGAIMLFLNLSIGEVVLKTKTKHQLPGYTKKYLGKNAEKIMIFGMLFGIYSALIAYLVGEGESLSRILPGNINPLYLGIFFWIIMTLLLREGLRGLKKIETYGIIVIIIIIICIFIFFFTQINPQNLLTYHKENIIFPIGIILFSLMGFTSIPELGQEIKGQEKDFKKAIIIGTLIPIFLYSIFTLTFIGVLGDNISRIATLSFGPFITVLGIFTMLTSFFVLSFSLKDMFNYDLNISNKSNFFLTSIVPLIIYIFITIFNIDNFTAILSIGGIIPAGLKGILILLINKKVKEKIKSKNSLLEVPNNWLIIIFISLVLISAIILEIIY